MTQNNTTVIDWTGLFEKHSGAWVALKDDERSVVSYARKAQQALEKAQEKGWDQPILVRVPTESSAYVGSYA